LRQIYFPIEDEKRWRRRYNIEIYDLYEDRKVTAFIKFRQLQWAGYIMRMVEQRMAKEVLQQIIHSKRRVGKPRERWEDGVRDDGIMLLGTLASKLKPKIENPGGNALRGLRQNLGCNTIAESESVKISC
jgi:hypothetical protein